MVKSAQTTLAGRIAGILIPFTFIAWTGLLVYLLATGLYKNYLKPGFYILLLVSALITLIFMLFSLSKAKKGSSNPADGFMRGGILLLPVVLILMTTDFSLGEYAYRKRHIAGDNGVHHITIPIDSDSLLANAEPFGTGKTVRRIADGEKENFIVHPFNTDTIAVQAMKPDSIGTKVDLGELVRRWELYRGAVVETEGLITRGDDGKLNVFRFVLHCCVGDARPVVLILEPTGVLPDIKGGSWVAAKGRIGVKQIGKGISLVLFCDGLSQRPAPPVDEQYLFAE